MTAIGYIFGVPALLAASAIWRGYVLTVLWAWFVVPTFAAPALAIAPAIGLSLVLGYLTQHVQRSRKDQSFAEVMAEGALNAATVPTLALFIGWIVQHWMPV